MLKNVLRVRYWPVWLGFGVAFLITRLPWSMQMSCGGLIGALGYRVARARRHIVEVNLELCFPELNQSARRRLAKDVFRSSGISIVETANAWMGNIDRLSERCRIHGLDHLVRAQEAGHGVLLLGMHLSTLDLCGALLARVHKFDVMYRPNKNRVIERLMTRGRERHFPSAIHRDDVRGVMKSLQAGHALWYGPDQDYGARHSVFAPFMGQSAATVTATARIVKMSHARVVTFSHYRRADATYDIYLSPLTDFPGGDAVADATRVNSIVERVVRECPEQYLWLHRRFKTRPGLAPRPYLPRAKRVSALYVNALVAEHDLLQGTSVRPGLLLTADGEIYKAYYRRGAFRSFMPRAPADRFASNGRALQRRGIDAPIAKLILYCADRHQHLVLYNRLDGVDLRALVETHAGLLLEALTAFLAELHVKGVYFRAIHLGNVLHRDSGFALLDTADLTIGQGQLSVFKCARNIAHLLNHDLDQQAFAAFGVPRFVSIYLAHREFSRSIEWLFRKRLKIGLRADLKHLV